MTSTYILDAIAAVVRPTGLRVSDLPTLVAARIADDDGDELGPAIGDVICRLRDGRYVYWHNNDRVRLDRIVRVAAYARA